MSRGNEEHIEPAIIQIYSIMTSIQKNQIVVAVIQKIQNNTRDDVAINRGIFQMKVG